jgi:hypothetical protein
MMDFRPDFSLYFCLANERGVTFLQDCGLLKTEMLCHDT